MANSFLKAFLIGILILILSDSFFHQRHRYVAADERLIESECRNAEAPAICLQCVKSDPDSVNADSVGIANIVVQCLRNYEVLLTKNVSNLANSATDQHVKTICETCVKGFQSVKTSLGSSKQALQIKNYDRAEELLNEALGYDATCFEELKPYKDKIPPQIFNVMKEYGQLSEAAFRIIERL